MAATPPPSSGVQVQALLVSGGPRVTSHITTALMGADDFSYLEVRTPQRALALLDEGRPFDVVIADADTTPTGGFALAREVKAREKMGRHVPPVVLLIARDQDKWLAEWSETDAWVLKPVDPFDLAEVVAALVQGRVVPALPGVGQPGARSAEARALEGQTGDGGPGGLGAGTGP